MTLPLGGLQLLEAFRLMQTAFTYETKKACIFNGFPCTQWLAGMMIADRNITLVVQGVVGQVMGFKVGVNVMIGPVRQWMDFNYVAVSLDDASCATTI